MTKSIRFSRKALSIVLSALMLMSVWVFVAPEKAAAAGEAVAVRNSSGAYVYFNSTASSVTAPTWTAYAQYGAVNGQDDIGPWKSMESGSWTVNGQSYNWRVQINRSEHKNEGGTYYTHFYSGSTYLGALTYYIDYAKTYDTEYYYTQGTQFIYQLILYYSSSSNSDASNWLSNNGWTDWSGNFNAGDKSNSKYVHSGYKTTTDPTVAIQRVLIADGHPTSVSYDGATYYAVGSGSITQTPTGGDGMVDLNKGNDGDDLYLMATADILAGPALTGLTKSQNGNSGTAQNNLINNGYTIATDQSGNYQDTNAGAGGDYNYVGYKSSCTALNTDPLYWAYRMARETYENGYNTSAITTALNNAMSILSDIADRYTCTYAQSDIDNAKNALLNALPSISLNSQQTVNLGVADKGYCYRFTPSSTTSYAFWAQGTDSSLDNKAWIYDATGTSLADNDDIGSSNSRHTALGVHNWQHYAIYSMSSGTTYYLYTRFLGSGKTGSYPVKVSKNRTIKFHPATNGSDVEVANLPVGHPNTNFNTMAGFTRENHTLVGWSNSSGKAYQTVANVDAIPDNSDLYALWFQTDAPVLSVNNDYTANVAYGYEMELYKFTPTKTKDYLIYGKSTTDDAVLLYNSNHASGSTEIASDDDDNGNVKSTYGVDFGQASTQFVLKATLTAGQTYYYGVKFYGNGTGSLPFRFEEIYDVTYNANGGNGAPGAQKKFYGKNITLSSTTPTRTGYDFLGWSTSSTATSANSSYAPGSTYSSNADLALYAVWKPINYTITYNVDGGTAISALSYTIESNSTLPAASKTGYTFNNWKVTTASGSWAANATFSSGTSVKGKYGSPTLTAQYTANNYTITYDTDGGNAISALSYTIASTNTLPTPTKTGYVFAGWKPTANSGSWSSGTTYAAGTSVSGKYGSVTLKAQWTPGTYTVTLNANGGSGGTASVTATYNAAMPSATMPTRTGYTFAGFYDTDAQTGGTQYYNASGASARTWNKASATTLYARWNINSYTVTFIDGHTGETLDTQTVEYGSAATAPAYTMYYQKTGDPAKHYAFSGWDKAFGNITGDITVTALYAEADHHYGGFTKVDADTHIHTCSDCGFEETLSHTWELESRNDSTCVQRGSEIYKCSGCNDEKTVTLPLADHQYTAQTISAERLVSAATCQQKAVYYYSCAVCGEAGSNTFEYGELADHKYTSYTYNNDATCTGAGTMTALCDYGCGTANTINDPNHPAFGHDYAFDSFVWADDNTAQAKLVCANDAGHIIYEDATVTSAFTAATCTEDAYTVYTAVYDGNTEDKTVTDEGTAKNHDYRFDSFIWADDFTSARVKLVCANDEHHVTYEDATVTSAFTAATCEEDAYTTYTATYGADTEDKIITEENTAMDHAYAFDSFVWAADNNTAKAKLVCSHDAEHVKYEDATVTSAFTAATCTEDAYTVYTAAYDGNTEDKTVTDEGTATGHEYELDSFIWADDYTAKAKLVCSHDAGHVKYEDATVTSAFTAATCEDDAYTVYTATYGGNTEDKTVTDEGTAISHDYRFDSFVWAADNTAQAKLVCANDAQHITYEDATVTSVFTAATCEDDAFTVYTATYGDKTEDKTVTDEGTAISHDYRFDSFVWAADNTAQAKLVCANNAEHITYEDATVTSAFTAATCTEDAYTVYTATYNGNTEDKTVTDEGTAISHDYRFNSFVWADDNSAQAKLVCANNAEHITYEDAAVTSVFHAATCEDDAYTVYTATYGSNTEDKTVTAAGTAINHDYRFDSFVWAADNSAQAKLVCANNAEHITYEDATVTSAFTAATCEDDAYTVYTATYGDKTEDKTVTDEGTAISHDYRFDSFVWAADNSAQAKLVCANDAEHITYADAAVTSAVTAPTCTEDGYTTYTATYDDKTEDKVVTAAGTAINHAYGFDSFVWADDNSAQAKLVCANNPQHITYEDAVVTSVFTAATCEDDAYTVYTATYGDNTEDKTVTNENTAISHAYGFDSFVWAADNTAQAKLVCANDAEHITYEDATVTSAFTAATCTEDAYTVYTATYNGNTEDKTVTDEGTAINHDYRFNSFVWAADNSAQAKLVCANNAEHITYADAAVTSAVTAPTCTEDGYTTYTATYGDETEDKVVTAAGTAINHDYRFDSFVWAADNSAQAKLVCANNAEHITYEDATVTSAFTAATCEDDAYTVYTATYGDKTEDKTVTDEGTAISHDYRFDSFVWAEDNSAQAKLVCANNGEHVIYEDGAVTSEFTAATCKADAFTVYTAAYGDETEDKTVTDEGSKLAHSYTGEVRNNEDGTHSFLCVNGCNEYGGTVGCDYDTEVTAPTCTAKGYTTYTCKVCGYSYTDDETDKLPHAFGAWTVTTEPGCVTAGEETRYCADCDAFETRPVSATGHAWNDGEETLAPTCTADGVVTYTCANCGETMTAVIAAFGHDWDRGEVTKLPTTKEEGEKTYTCRRCGETRVETVAKANACKVCGAAHNKNLVDRLLGLIHAIWYYILIFERTF